MTLAGSTIAFGLLTAVLFAASTLGGSRAIRHLPDTAVVGWASLTGLVLLLPALLTSPLPSVITPEILIWWSAFGICNIAGLLVVYAAFRVGKVGLLAPIVATEGSVAAIIATLTGESLPVIAGLALLVIVGGIVLTAMARDPAPLPAERPLLSIVLAVIATLIFGMNLYASGKLSGQLPMAWYLAPPRLVGTLFLAIPLLIARRLPMRRAAIAPVLIIAVAEIVAFITYSMGAQQSIAITAVLSSQFAPLTTIVAWLVYKERLGRVQVIGIVTILIGVVTLTLATQSA